MTEYKLSKSPYLNQLINNLFAELQARPKAGGDLTNLQEEVVEEINQSKINVNGREIEMNQLMEEAEQDIFPELMSFVLMKVIFKMKDKAMTQFIEAQNKNVLEYKVVVESHNIFRNFIHSGFHEFSQRPETSQQAAIFISLIQKKFEAKVLMLDEVDDKSEITWGKMILLEDGHHIVTESRRENYSQFSHIIMELLLKDKEINTAFANILKASFTKNDDKTQAFTSALVRDYISMTIKKFIHHEPFYSEQPLHKFVNHVRANTSTYYIENEKVGAMEFVTYLVHKQFNPRKDTKNIMKKLGI